MRRHRAGRLERRLRQERAQPARILAFPGAQLQQVGPGEDQLEAPCFARTAILTASEHQPAAEQRLESGRKRGHDEEPARLGHAMEQLHARRRQARRIAQLGQGHESPGDLRRSVETLGRVDPHSQPGDERIQLARRERAKDVDEPSGGG